MIYNYMKYIYIIYFPNAIAIGVLTSNRRGGRRTTLADWTWHQGAIAGCHCSVLWLGASVTTNFGGVDVVPLLGAHGTPRSNGIQKSIQKNCLELRSDVTLFWTLITQTLVFAIWGLCWYIFFIFACKNKTCISIVRGLLVPIFRLGWSGKGDYSHVGVIDHLSVCHFGEQIKCSPSEICSPVFP